MKAHLQTNLKKLTSKTPRRLRQLVLAGALALLGREQAVAQVSTYSFTQSSGTFTPITGGTMIIDGTSTTSLDSWTSSSITIPAVTVNQVQYTTAWITSNGLLKLGGTSPSTTLYTGNSTAPAGGGVHLCVFNADLNKATSTTASEIRWETVGNEVVFQWKGWCRYGITENFDMQVRINTITGEIKYVYNLNSGPGTSTSYQPQVGMATSTTDFNNRSVTTTAGQNWNNSIAGTANSATCRFTGSTTDPRNFVSGQTYLWTPPTCPAPPSIANSAVTSGGATITWTAATPLPSNGYEYYISTSSTAPTASTTATGTASGTSKILSGLPAATQQYVWIRSVCSGSDKSVWTGPTNFTTLCATPVPGATIATPNANLCSGSTVAFSLTTVPTGNGLSYLWQSSNDGTTYTSITSATSSTYTAAVTDRFYRCRVVCSAGPDTVYSTPVQLNYTNNIMTATGAQRCGAGTVSLTATANTGATINWFTAATGGTSIGTGSPFTTPSISATTTYYAEASTITAAAMPVGAGALTSGSAPYSPFNGGYGGMKSQYLFTAAELQSAGFVAGNITSLAFDITTAGSALTGFTIQMATTTLTTFGTTDIQATPTTVYPSATFTPVVGINTFTFATPFNWDGTSNIIVSTSWSNGNTSNTSSVVKYDATTNFSSQSYRKDSETAPNMLAFTGPTGAGTYTYDRSQNRPKIIFNAQYTCRSSRLAVNATVNTAPVFDVTNNKTVCNNATTTLTVNSTQASYNNVTWSPVTNLFTDAAATVPYTAGTHAYTVYQKSATAGLVTYIATANNTTTLCGAVDTVKIQTIPANAAAIAATGILCNTGTSVINLSPAIAQTGVVYQWQNSADNTTFANITTNGTGTSYTTPTLTATQYYRAIVKNSDSAVCFTSVSDTVLVSNPTITGTTPATRCGTGVVTLAATANAGSTVRWYAAATGGTSLGTGNSFITPQISATTNFFAEPGTSVPSSIRVGAGTSSNSTTSYPNPLSAYYGGTKHQMLFLASELQAQGLLAGNITSIAFDVTAFAAAGICNDFTIKLGTTTNTAMTGFVTGTSTVYNASYTPSATGVVTFNFTTPYNWDGTSNLIVETIHNAGNGGNGSGTTVAYTATTFNSVYARAIDNITPATAAAFDASTSTSGVTTTSPNRPNIVFGGIGKCAGTRQQVTATVTPAPAFDVTNDKTVCNNAITTLTVSSPAANFNNVTWTPVANLYTNAAATTPYTAGTNASTVYYKNATSGTAMVTANALNTTSQCANLDTVKIQTLPSTANSVAAVKDFCQSGSTTLSITPAITQTNFSYQWQNSANNVAFTDITTGGTSATYTTPTLNATQYYRAVIKNSDGASCFNTASDTVRVYNPTILTNTPAERCGPGVLTLSATTAAGNTLKWFTALTGGTPVGTGNNFTTPSLSATTNYYVSAESYYAKSIRIGAGTSSNSTTSYPNPLSGFYGGTKHQMLFLASELQAAGLVAGNIKAISFDVTAINATATCNDFTIRMGTTNNTAMSGFVSGTTPVYNASYTPTATGVVTFTFTTPFNWDGTSNVILETVHNSGNGGNGSGTTVAYTATTFNSVYARSIDNITPATAAAFDATTSTSGVTTTSMNRPNVVFLGQTACISPRTTVAATIKAKPTAGLTPTGTINICAGQSQTLTATGGGAYSWLNNTSLISSQTASTLTVNQTGNYKAIVTNTTSGCSDTSVAANVTVNAKPVVNLGNDTAVCANVPLTLNAGNPGAAYLWNDNSTNSTLVAAAAGQYRVKVTNSFNCSTSDTINIAHKVVPVVNLGNDTMICHVQPLTLNAANPGAAYLWNTGATSQTISVNQAGTYSVSVTNASNCTGTDAIAITIMPQPVNDGFNFVPLFNEAMGKVRFEPINPAQNYTYAWNFGDGVTSTLDSPVHTFAAAGDYLVTMDVSNGCTDTSVTLLIRVDFTVGTATVVKNNIDMRLYPNPAQDQLKLELVGDNIYFRNISVHNVVGQKVIDLKTQKTVTEKINLSQLPAGMYILKAETDKGMVMRKFEVIK
ncbi:Ig-like domain-containing protein [Edaphocola flava]|uniref:Ig-like domain-containing protein n=1 Tax=Edaphocola flava TaxID=2499629 RepID=UPI00100A7431|nr:T9SS type A sorting domain-containing protein [Edaphocola flava]